MKETRSNSSGKLAHMRLIVHHGSAQVSRVQSTNFQNKERTLIWAGPKGKRTGNGCEATGIYVPKTYLQAHEVPQLRQQH